MHTQGTLTRSHIHSHTHTYTLTHTPVELEHGHKQEENMEIKEEAGTSSSNPPGGLVKGL